MARYLSPQQALVYAMITISAVDRKMTDKELARIGTIVDELPVFNGCDRDWLVEESQQCGKFLSKPEGLDKVLDLIAGGLTPNLSETAYVLAAEVAASDLKVDLAEVRFLELLAEKLQLDKLTCAALERAARARHQKA
jgi:uncharacterized membrane protein YebE (DUF533 family)